MTVDLDEWFTRNQAPLAPHAVNEWVFMVRAVPDVADSDAEILTTIRRILFPLVPGAGRADTRLVETSVKRITPSEGTVTRRENIDMGPLPILGQGPIVWARVQFPNRSALTSVPWVSKRVRAMTHTGDEILQADVVLDSVGKAIGATGEEPNIIEDLLGHEVEMPAFLPENPVAAVGVVAAGAFGLWLLAQMASKKVAA